MIEIDLKEKMMEYTSMARDFIFKYGLEETPPYQQMLEELKELEQIVEDNWS